MNGQQQEKLRQLYRLSRQEQPSSDMDGQIRNAAQRALNRGRNRWIWGLSTAAVLMLSFNVVIDLFMGEQGETKFSELDVPSSSGRMNAEKQSAVREKTAEEIEPQQAVPAAPAPAPINEFYRALPRKEMEFDRDSLSEDTAFPGVRKKEHALSKRSVIGAQTPAPTEIAATRKLPHQLAELLELAEGLSGEELASGKIMLYSSNKLILTVEPAADGFRFKAWQGVETLGVREDWDVSPSSLGACNDQGAYASCTLRPGVVGYFEAERLDHVSWIQANE